MAKKKILKVAFIGGGGIAGHHAAQFKKHDDVEIVAMSDVAAASRKSWAEQYDIPVYADYKKMLREVRPQLTDVCTPNFLHFKPAMDAMQAGSHVFVEKPMAMNARECKAMVARSKKLRRKLVVGFQHRFESRVQFIKEAIEKGRFGKILFTRVSYYRRRGIPNWGVFGRKELQGGGGLIDVGVHALEQAWYAIGRPKPVAVSGNAWTFIGNDPKKARDIKCSWPNWDTKTYNVDDLAVGQIRFEDNSILALEVSFAMHNQDEDFNYKIHGEKAGATLDPLKIYTDDYGHMVDVTPAYLPNTDIWEVKMRGVIDHVLHNGPNLAPGEDGLMVQQMLDGIYQSAAAGKEVRVR
ncbi:MAG: Gfo/Idh/MocA family oxidoreductase [Verrucomicrobia bacterium]|nr:Gfo/Idh/MocA family oxidoreductase [Verrucomicrobiota bacterium]MDA1086308.1 Gfo/Idh/MocA family oxidoreductase [Verrucomicrobiota bacterium]